MKSSSSGRSSAEIAFSTVGFLLIPFLFLTLVLANKVCASVEGPPLAISTAADDQQNPRVISLSDRGLWFVVWEDGRNWKRSGSDIYGQFITSDGELCGSEIAISTALSEQTVPQAAYRDTLDDSDDKVLVVWQDERGDADSGYIYYREIDVTSIAADCSGYSAGPEREVSFTPTDAYYPGNTNGEQLRARWNPKISYDSVRRVFWLSWVEIRDENQHISEPCFQGLHLAYWIFGDTAFPGYVAIDGDTLAERPNHMGVEADIIRDYPTRTNRLISHDRDEFVETYEYEYFTDISSITQASDTTAAETLFVWQGSRHTATLTCTCEDTNESDSCDAGDDAGSKLELSASDDGLIHIYGIFAEDIHTEYIYSTRIDSSGSPSYHPVIGFDSVGRGRNFLVAWEDLRDGGGRYTKVYGQLIEAGGGLYKSNFIVSFQDTDSDGTNDENVVQSSQTWPDISYDPTHQRFFVTWQDGRNTQVSLENIDIYGQAIDHEGSLRGGNFPIAISGGNQLLPSTAYNRDNHQFFTTWKDSSNTTTATFSDVYGQRFSLGNPQLILLNQDDTPLVPPVLYFGTLMSGQTSTQQVYIQNLGDSTLHIDCTSTLTSPFSFTLLPSQLSACDDGRTITLMPQDKYSYPLGVSFSPTEEETYQSEFTIYSDAGSLNVSLTGIGQTEAPTSASVSVSPTTLTFDDINIGETRSDSLTFTNNGNIDVTVLAVDTLPSMPFSISGLSAGTIIPKNSSLDNVLVTFNPTEEKSYSATIFVLYDSGVQSSEITISGRGTAVGLVPSSLSFPATVVGETRSLTVEVTNFGDSDITVSQATVNSPFVITGIASGTAVTAGSTVTGTVTFSPKEPGSFAESLQIVLSSSSEARTIPLTGTGIISGPTYSLSTSTAESAYQLAISTSTTASGRLYILAMHDPLTGGNIYAYTPSGYQLFGTDFVSVDNWNPVDNWNTLYYAPSATGTPTVTLNDPTGASTWNMAGLGGTLYVGSFVEDSLTAFDFEQSLVKLMTLSINSLDGEWVVTDTYSGADYILPHHLVISESGSAVSATWGPYNPTISYGTDGGYVIRFTHEGNTYTYTIEDVETDSFAGTWSFTDGASTSTAQSTKGARVQ